MNPETYVSPKTISKALKNGTEDIHENDDPGDNFAILQSYNLIILIKPALIFVFRMQVAVRNRS